MKTFDDYLKLTQEIGFVDQMLESIAYAHGLPSLNPGEMVIFETGDLGYTIGIHPDYVEIMLLSPLRIEIGTRVTRMKTNLKVKIGDQHLGSILYSEDFEKTIFCFDEETSTTSATATGTDAGSTTNTAATTGVGLNDGAETRALDHFEPAFAEREQVKEQLETGITIVDL